MCWPRGSYLLSSKVFWGPDSDKPNCSGLTKKHIIEACNGSLRRLQTEYLDIYYCHRLDPATPLEETVLAMNHLLNQGKILYWGTSEWSAVDILRVKLITEKLNLVGPIAEQPQYNLVYRSKVEEEFKVLYSLLDLGITTYSPLLSGLLTGKYHNIDNDNSARLNKPGNEWIKEIVFQVEEKKLLKNTGSYVEYARSIGIKPTHLALAWCYHNKNVSSIILGASSVNQLKDNLDTIKIIPTIKEEFYKEAEKIFLE